MALVGVTVRSITPKVFHSAVFTTYFLGQLTSQIGTRMAPVALSFGLLGTGRSAASLGVVLAFTFLPQILLALVGGVVADNLPRRRLLLVTDLVQASTQFATGTLLILGTTRLWPFLILQFCYGCATAYAGPALAGQIADVTPSKDLLQQANSLIGLTRSIGGVTGPTLAAVVMAWSGAGTVVIADAVTFLISATCMLFLPDVGARVKRRNMRAEIRDGWQELISRSWVWIMIIDGVAYHFCIASSIAILGPSISLSRWHGASAWAAVLTARSVGAVFSGLVLLRFRIHRGLFWGRLFLSADIGLLLMMAYSRVTIWFLVVAFCSGAALTAYTATWRTSLQRHIPSQKLSRVSAFDWLAAFAFAPIGYSAVGFAATRYGAVSVLIAGVTIHAIATLAVLMAPAVRNLRNV